MLLKELLAQANVAGSDFDQLVVIDELDGLLQREADRRCQHDVLVVVRSTHVVELLALGGVYRQLVGTVVDADQHALVDFGTVVDDQLATLLQGVERIGQRLAVDHRDQHAIAPFDGGIGLERAVVVEAAGENAGARSEGHEVATETDQAASGNQEVEAYAALAIGVHVGQLALAIAELLHDGALVLLLAVDDYLFIGLLLDPVDLLDDHLGTTYRQFEAFATHGFNQHREVQFATARDDELL